MSYRQKGFSLLELAVVVVVVMLLAWTMLSFLGRYQGVVERDMVEMNIRNMRTGMRLHVAQMLLEGHQYQLPSLVGTNPVRFLGDKLSDYHGEVTGALPDYLGELDIPPAEGMKGCWYFDRSQRMLAYRPKSSGFPGGSGVELRWQVVPSGGQDSGIKLIETGVGQ